MPLPIRRQPTSRPHARTLLFAVVTCWLIVLAAPVRAQTPDPADPATGDAPGITAAADSETLEVAGTDPAGDLDGGADADRGLVLGLIATVLLAVTIGLHALYRDRD